MSRVFFYDFFPGKVFPRQSFSRLTRKRTRLNNYNPHHTRSKVPGPFVRRASQSTPDFLLAEGVLLLAEGVLILRDLTLRDLALWDLALWDLQSLALRDLQYRSPILSLSATTKIHSPPLPSLNPDNKFPPIPALHLLHSL